MKKNTPSACLVVLLHFLLTSLVLCTFALFHHVIPYANLARHAVEPIGIIAHHPEHPAEAQSPTVSPAEAAPNPVPEPLSWRDKFHERFSAEPKFDGYRYASPNIAFEVSRIEHSERFPSLTYFVADIYVADIRCLQTAVPGSGSFAEGIIIARQNNALLAINGDSMLTSGSGLIVRNGMIYCTSSNQLDICVLYYDGSMAVYEQGEYDPAEILAMEPYQIWQFGPSLLDENGKPLQSFNTSRVLSEEHPRTAIGYYEPGHYCFVVVDGRQRHYSSGADISTLAALMSELGCCVAYNLDGGATSMMVLDGQLINRPSSKREIGDMLIVTELNIGEDGEI